MKKLLVALMLSAVSSLSLASEGGIELFSFEPELADQAALQSGAKTFVNYCYGCHNMKYMRYNRLANDLGIPEDVALNSFIFDDSKIGSLMANPLATKTAKRWFGAAPPDLTLVARARGPEWLYTYLKTFYLDESRPYSYNNLAFKDVGMPNVLANLQGDQLCKPAFAVAANGGEKRDPLTGAPVEDPHSTCGRVEHVDGTGSLSPEEFDELVSNLVSFLVYAGEPMRLHDRTFLGIDLNKREVIGVYCLLFLSVFLVFALLLNREYWKGIH